MQTWTIVVLRKIGKMGLPCLRGGDSSLVIFWKFYARIIYLSSLLLSSVSVVVVSTYRTDESKMEIVKSV